ncbi:hypothetical protein [Streptomyces sp. NPDC001480]|uniref:hypothetical protein n=1 Tax=Streptomyces sp. NPDC001480 TaxID=3364577 RepID=UPI0036C90BDC
MSDEIKKVVRDSLNAGLRELDSQETESEEVEAHGIRIEEATEPSASWHINIGCTG